MLVLAAGVVAAGVVVSATSEAPCLSLIAVGGDIRDHANGVREPKSVDGPANLKPNLDAAVPVGAAAFGSDGSLCGASGNIYFDGAYAYTYDFLDRLTNVTRAFITKTATATAFFTKVQRLSRCIMTAWGGW